MPLQPNRGLVARKSLHLREIRKVPGLGEMQCVGKKARDLQILPAKRLTGVGGRLMASSAAAPPGVQEREAAQRRGGNR